MQYASFMFQGFFPSCRNHFFQNHLDSMFSVRWKNYFTSLRDGEHADGRNLAQSVTMLEPTLRSALCIGDYMASQCLEMKDQQDKDSEYIAELNGQNKQMKVTSFQFLYCFALRENFNQWLSVFDDMKRTMKN